MADKEEDSLQLQHHQEAQVEELEAEMALQMVQVVALEIHLL